MFQLDTNRKASDRNLRLFCLHPMRVHFTCIFFSLSGLLTVWSVSLGSCFISYCQGAVLSKVVELAGVEPASQSVVCD
mgnify:CR=1 FL=1